MNVTINLAMRMPNVTTLRELMSVSVMMAILVMDKISAQVYLNTCSYFFKYFNSNFNKFDRNWYHNIACSQAN